MKQFLTLIFAVSLSSLTAQTVADFENFDLAPESFLNGSDGSGGFSSGNIFVANSYNENYGSWSGWAISNTTDTLTPGFMNQYSSITGGGVDGSSTYAVSFFASNMVLTGEGAGKVVDGMYITNNTYAYLSMRDGDQFAKKFGGVDGNDPDFFLLTIKKYFNGALSTDSIDFYLADYRFEDNSQDYIVDEWTYLDLSSLGNVDSLQFTLMSSDTSSFGFNTPGYFCVDNVTTTDVLASLKRPSLAVDFTIYPNPTTEVLYFTWEEEQGQVQIINLQGQILSNQALQLGQNSLEVANLPQGNYFLNIVTEKGNLVERFVKL